MWKSRPGRNDGFPETRPVTFYRILYRTRNGRFASRLHLPRRLKGCYVQFCAPQLWLNGNKLAECA